MKNYAVSLALGLMMIAGMSSCFHNRHDMSISVSDDDDEFEMDADYGRNRSHAVQVYLDEHLLNNGRSLKTTGEIILDDKTTFYINSNPGQLTIRINKNENSEESCERVREICEDIKVIIEDN